MDFLTLDEYLLGARKILNLYGYKCHKNNDDAIAFVAYYMMKADQTWDGTSSAKTTWRFNQARYAILKLKNKHKKQRRLVSLNKVINEKDNRKTFLSDIISDNKEKFDKDLFSEIIHEAHKHLSKRQLECITMYYIDGLNLEETGQKLGITKQAVSLHVKNAIEKLKNVCQN
jgi:RNA polymerase sigma factor (sigma-70 family)